MSAGAIALAEFLPESVSLLHLDLTMNTLDLAGVMALNSGLRANHVMRCLDLNIPPDDEEMARYVTMQFAYGFSKVDFFGRMCRDILNTCIRNTEEAEWNAQLSSANGVSGRGQGKGVWGMIEESRLAKTLRKDGLKKVESRSPREPPESLLISGGTQNESEAVVQAQQCRDQLRVLIARSTPTSGSDAAEPQEALELIERAKTLLPGLVEVIRTCSDSGRLDELLNLNDTLVSLVAQASPKPKASLQGLGLELNGLGNTGTNNDRGVVNNHIVSPRGDSTEEPSDDDSPSTPRLDKGKGKAPPEPKIVKPVLSPRGFAAPDSDSDSNEHEHEAEPGEDDPRSPTDL